ncbi:MAG TPA: hypothetical protein PKD86_19290 [Gemmatales bacterium]|nr:hypothetical protein [Gemmatales bacterium]HMP61493.1 hypothetical protein [Gemmatales bacterium]
MNISDQVAVWAMIGAGLLILFVALIGGLLLERRRREMDHLERLKSLEMGIPLPDAEVARVRWAGLATILLGGSAMVAAGVTSWLVIVRVEEAQQQIALLAIIWGCAAGVGVVSAMRGLGQMRRQPADAGKQPVRYT